MAIYKGREVTITSTVNPGLTVYDTVQVTDRQGQSFSPKVSELQFTEAEKTDLKKYHTNKYDQVQVISDADLQKLRDDSDPVVIEKRQAEAAKKLVNPTPVTIVPANTPVVTQPKAVK